MEAGRCIPDLEQEGPSRRGFSDESGGPPAYPPSSAAHAQLLHPGLASLASGAGAAVTSFFTSKIHGLAAWNSPSTPCYTRSLRFSSQAVVSTSSSSEPEQVSTEDGVTEFVSMQLCSLSFWLLLISLLFVHSGTFFEHNGKKELGETISVCSGKWTSLHSPGKIVAFQDILFLVFAYTKGAVEHAADLKIRTEGGSLITIPID